MRRVAGPLVAIVTPLFVPLALVCSAAEELADLIERAEKSVVRINVERLDGEAVGSGFLIGAGKLATNHHVMEGARQATAEFSDGSELRIKGYLASDSLRDVVILAVEENDRRQPFRLASEVPRKGERAVAIGAPKGLSFSSSDGIISAVRSNEELETLMEIRVGHADMTWIQTTAPISPGNSGGPLINMAGEIIGMNTMGRSGGQNLNFAVSAADIDRVLQKGGKVKSLSKMPRSKLRDEHTETARGDGSPVITLPSGKVLDIDEIFLAMFRNQAIIFRVNRAAGTRVATFRHPNGNVSTLATETQGVLDGQMLSAYETGEPAMFANYASGLREGNLLTWDERGERIVFAQYLKDKPHGLVCLFRNDRLWLVQEADRGRILASHLIAGNSIDKSYPAGAPADKKFTAASDELNKALASLHESEVKLKKSIRELERNRRKATAHANNLIKRGVTADDAVRSEGADQAVVNGLITRALRGAK